MSPAQSLVPPRPNLGPEPWVDEGGSWPTTIGAGVAIALVIAIGGWRWTRARRRSAADRAGSGPTTPVATDPWISASEAARDALARAFGASWRSKSTEEVAADPALRDRLGPDRMADLIEVFLRADRAKFAGPAPPSEDEPDASGIGALVAAIGEAAPREPGRR